MHDIFNVCSEHTMFTLLWAGISKTHSADYASDTPEGQGHQNCNTLVDPKEGYNRAMFENLT